MIRSIKNKRLRHEIPLLPYKTYWEEDSNELTIPEYNMKLIVNDWYPFQYPTLYIDGVEETSFVKLIRRNHSLQPRITEIWCPCYGIREFVDDFLHVYMPVASE
jgi:hypothetical protein